MENNTTSTSQDNIFSVHIDHEATSYLRSIASWARIIAIAAFCSAGLALLQVFIGGGRYYSNGTPIVMSSLFVVAVGAVSVIINLYLLRFANAADASLKSMNQGQFNLGINYLRTYFKIIGMILVVMLSLVLIAIIFMFIGQSFV